jgi:hypothetical protein
MPTNLSNKKLQIFSDLFSPLRRCFKRHWIQMFVQIGDLREFAVISNVNTELKRITIWLSAKQRIAVGGQLWRLWRVRSSDEKLSYLKSRRFMSMAAMRNFNGGLAAEFTQTLSR